MSINLGFNLKNGEPSFLSSFNMPQEIIKECIDKQCSTSDLPPIVKKRNKAVNLTSDFLRKIKTFNYKYQFH